MTCTPGATVYSPQTCIMVPPAHPAQQLPLSGYEAGAVGSLGLLLVVLGVAMRRIARPS